MLLMMRLLYYREGPCLLLWLPTDADSTLPPDGHDEARLQDKQTAVQKSDLARLAPDDGLG